MGSGEGSDEGLGRIGEWKTGWETGGVEAGRVGRAEILVWEGDLGLCEGLVLCCRLATLQLIGNTLRMSLGVVDVELREHC